MNKLKRQIKIIEELKSEGVVNINHLHEKLNVSKVTIRSDIEELDQKGYLVKTRGGGVLSNNRNLVRLIEKTIHEYEYEKDLIAQTAAKLVKPGMRIIIDSGSTTSFLPRYLKEINLTVITNSLIVVHELCGLENINLIVSGGTLRHESQSLIGISSLSFFDAMNADILFLGATGFSADRGASASDIMEAETKKMMISSSEYVYLLIDSSKFGKNSLSRICQASDLTAVITDSISNKLVHNLKDHNVSVLQSIDKNLEKEE
ncbi:MAG: DeoR/GlpR transcriptional regulator [Spirochaetales bacterium]|nr:DeoR/GlpR transcriptional regulator [Spirochaetales bacterium]